MTNPYYAKSGAPGNHASGSSAAIRAEFALIEAAFDKMPGFVGNGGKPIGVSAAEDGFTALSAINSTPIGTTTRAAGNFTTLSANAGITGNLTGNVNGNVSGSSTTCTGNAATATTAVNATNATTAAACTGNAATASSAGYATNAGAATTASTATSAPWTGITGRPTLLSQFTNDSGFVTSIGAAAAGALTGATLASNVLASSLTSVGTLASLTVAGAGSFGGVLALANNLTVAGTSTVAGVLSSQAQFNATGSQSSVIATATTSLGGVMVQGPGGSTAAFMGFHRPGSWAEYFGLDTDNQWKHGGWSAGAAASVFIDSANYGTYTVTKAGVGASGTWGINISGNATTATAATTAAACSGNAATATTATSLSGGTVAATTITGTTVTASGLVKGNGGGQGLGAITVSTAAPSGGVAGDLWFQY